VFGYPIFLTPSVGDSSFPMSIDGGVALRKVERLYNHPQKGNLLHVTVWMDLEDTMTSEISQAQKDKCHMVIFTRDA
jgi:hypothetical protein